MLLHISSDGGSKGPYLVLTGFLSAASIAYHLGMGGLATVFGVLTALTVIVVYA